MLEGPAVTGDRSLLAGARSREEIARPDGCGRKLAKWLIERALKVELTEHLGYEPQQERPGGAGHAARMR
jgi:transposase-like protein